MSSEPLKDKSKSSSIDVEKMLKGLVQLRLPRLNSDMRTGPAPKKDLDVGRCAPARSCKDKAKRLCASLLVTIVAMFKSILAIPKAMLRCCKGCIPSVAGIKAFFCGLLMTLRKYSLDIVTNGAVFAGPYIIGLYVSAELASTYDALFLVYFGAFSSIVLLLKNLNLILAPLYQVIDEIEKVIDKAINLLISDINNELYSLFGLVEGPAIGLIVNDAIRKAQPELSPRKHLPRALRRKLYCIALIGVPIISYLCYSAYASGQDLFNDSPSTTTKVPSETSATSESVEGAVDLFSISGLVNKVIWPISWISKQTPALRDLIKANAKRAENLIKANAKMAETLATNLLLAFLATVPLMCLFVNSMIRCIERGLNTILLSLVKGKIPGGVDGLQADVDKLDAITPVCCTVS